MSSPVHPPESVDFVALEESEERYNRAVKAKNTWILYDSRWKSFERWCEKTNQPALAATEATVRHFITWLLDVHRARLWTVRVSLTAIADRYRREGLPSPVTTNVWIYVRNCGRHLKERPLGKAALTIEHLKRIAALSCTLPMYERDRGIVLLGFACGWRRSELASLDLADVSFQPQGVVLHLRSSKTDQRGEGRTVGIHFGKSPETCPVRGLERWIKIRGSFEGPLFVANSNRRDLTHERMSGQAICRALQRSLQRIGVNPKDYGAHSLRSGFVTTAVGQGVPELAIMDRTGHRNISTLQRYVRPAQAFRFNPLEKVL